jgi:hypothetical protein
MEQATSCGCTYCVLHELALNSVTWITSPTYYCSGPCLYPNFQYCWYMWMAFSILAMSHWSFDLHFWTLEYECLAMGNAWIGICYHLSTVQKFFLTPPMSSREIIGLNLVTLPDIRVYKKDPSLFLATYWNLS